MSQLGLNSRRSRTWHSSSVWVCVVFSVMKFFIPANRRAEAAEILRSVQERLGIHPEYLGAWIQERDHPCSHIVYVEQWRSEEAIYEHIRSALYRYVLSAMDFSSQAPEVAFYFVSHIKGMELIHSLRGKQATATAS